MVMASDEDGEGYIISIFRDLKDATNFVEKVEDGYDDIWLERHLVF